MERQVDAAGQGHLAFTLPQTLDGQVDCSQRGGADRIHSHGGPMEMMDIGNAVGDGRTIQGEGKPPAPVNGLGADQGIVIMHDAGKNAHPASAPTAPGAHKVPGCVSGIRDGLCAYLQKQAFLGIHCFRFTGGDLKIVRVKAIGVLDKAAPLGQFFAGGGLKISPDLPGPAFFGDRCDAIFALF